MISAKWKNSKGLVTAQMKVKEWVVTAFEAVTCVVVLLMRFQAHLTPFQSDGVGLGHWPFGCLLQFSFDCRPDVCEGKCFNYLCESAFPKGANVWVSIIFPSISKLEKVALVEDLPLFSTAQEGRRLIQKPSLKQQSSLSRLVQGFIQIPCQWQTSHDNCHRLIFFKQIFVV